MSICCCENEIMEERSEFREDENIRGVVGALPIFRDIVREIYMDIERVNPPFQHSQFSHMMMMMMKSES